MKPTHLMTPEDYHQLLADFEAFMLAEAEYPTTGPQVDEDGVPLKEEHHDENQ